MLRQWTEIRMNPYFSKWSDPDPNVKHPDPQHWPHQKDSNAPLVKLIKRSRKGAKREQKRRKNSKNRYIFTAKKYLPFFQGCIYHTSFSKKKNLRIQTYIFFCCFWQMVFVGASMNNNKNQFVFFPRVC